MNEAGMNETDSANVTPPLTGISATRRLRSTTTQMAVRDWLRVAAARGVPGCLPGPDDENLDWWLREELLPRPAFRTEEGALYELDLGDPAHGPVVAVPVRPGMFTTPSGGRARRSLTAFKDAGEAFFRFELLRRVLRHDAIMDGADMSRLRDVRGFSPALAVYAGFEELAVLRERYLRVEVLADQDARRDLPAPVRPEVTPYGVAHSTCTGNTRISMHCGHADPHMHDHGRTWEAVLSVERGAPLNREDPRDRAIAVLSGYCGTVADPADNEDPPQYDERRFFHASYLLGDLRDRTPWSSALLTRDEANDLVNGYLPDEQAWEEESAWAAETPGASIALEL